jgi:hypothetical protein
MGIKINLRVVPFGQIVYQTGAPASDVEETAAIDAQEPTRYHVPREAAPRVLEIRYEQEIPEYRAPSSTG